MANGWTNQQVLDLAPDAASVKAGRSQSQVSKWPVLGAAERALWGEVKGSGKKPYQVCVDLHGPAFKCSCPSRKFPCKHSIGLMLIYADQADCLTEGEAPDWVGGWLTERDQRAERQVAKAQAASDKPVDEKAQAKRAARREDRVRSGVEQLGVLLTDIARQGLAWAHAQPYSFWDGAASRLVDAQAPGLARLVRELGDVAGSGARWQPRFLSRLGRLHLAVNAYARLDRLPDATKDDLRTIIGWTVSKERLAGLTIESGRWCVAAQRTEQEDRLTVQKTWLVRVSDGRPALLLDFTAAGQPATVAPPVGSSIQADLTYYPGTLGVRAVIASQQVAAKAAEWPGLDGVELVRERFADALALNPWLEQLPVCVAGVRLAPPGSGDGRWSIVDRDGALLSLGTGRRDYWPLLSASGGGEMTVFGEWDGDRLSPLAVWTDGVCYTVSDRAHPAPIARVA
ncbi:hypothetical protein KOR34_09000 [Posidoniimonas corsicana]|uniref:SWIM-type domain-containing protein n=1 Tax=Posidoniimonas corsicana TaxID=1938618 RepID=A0A5C5VDC3_9BACT|nr:SWIM zinc finger family protein [Posidoniimonas corsicana]TWT36003.1 hypothetical protein KOR34_09000 [Posidoniimonas corsicana]